MARRTFVLSCCSQPSSSLKDSCCFNGAQLKACIPKLLRYSEAHIQLSLAVCQHNHPFKSQQPYIFPCIPYPIWLLLIHFFPCWSIMTVTLLCISQGKVPYPGALRPTACTWRSPSSSLCFSSVFSKSQFPAPLWHEGLLFVLWPRATTCLLWANICFLQLRCCQWWPHHTSWPSASAMCCPHLIHFLYLGLQIPKSSASSYERQPSFDTPLFLLDLRYIHSAVWTANKTHENDRIPALGKQNLQAAVGGNDP